MSMQSGYTYDYNNSFPFQIWITTIVASPLLFVLIQFLLNWDWEILTSAGSLIFVVPLGFIFSTPTFLLLSLSIKYLKHKQAHPLLIKGWALILILTCIWITFILIEKYILKAVSINYDASNEIAIYYAIAGSLSILYFKVTNIQNG